MLPFIRYPRDNSRDWSEIVALYASFPDNPFAAAMERLVCRLRDAGYVAAGLHGSTSMLNLNLGPAEDVLNNPHLLIQSAGDRVRLTYEDGSKAPGCIEVEYQELCERVEQVLVKRARWFRDHRTASAADSN